MDENQLSARPKEEGKFIELSVEKKSRKIVKAFIVRKKVTNPPSANHLAAM